MAMRRLQLDFLHPTTARGVAGPLLLAVGVVALLLSLWQQHTLDAESKALQASLAATPSATQAATPVRARVPLRLARLDDRQLAQEVERANVAIATLSVPWPNFFAELEAASDPKVALLAIQPEADGRRIRISGEARRFQDMLGYLTRLEATPGLANVLLVSHEVRSANGTRGTTVGFTLTADWVGRS
ncbi:MAG: putative secretion system transrane protein 1 [Rhizobacter sp.]|nr:putative secretion system transrane protein 1 [Rhizobacter sp.]